MLRIGLVVLAVLVGGTTAQAKERGRDSTSERAQRPHTLTCWEGGVRVFQQKGVTVRHYTGGAESGLYLIIVRNDGREIVVYTNGGLCILEEQ